MTDEMLTEISTFLAGISFASILLLYQFKGSIDSSTTYYLTWSLSLSVVFFIFTAMFCLRDAKKKFTDYFHVFLGFSAFASFFVSLYLFLSLLNQMVATVIFVLAVVFFIIFVAVGFTE